MQKEVDLPTYVPHTAGDLLEKCLEADPKKRIEIEAVLNHDFFTEGTLTPSAKKDSGFSGSSFGSVPCNSKTRSSPQNRSTERYVSQEV